jgi:hypothetical protein
LSRPSVSQLGGNDGHVTGRGTTHEVFIDHGRCLVTKRFRSWDRGEPAREWAALTLLAEFAPGLPPAPIRADLDAHPPAIVMSCLPGTALGDASEQARLREFRRLAALFWLLLLLPGGEAGRRNPSGTLGRQAERLLALLG